MCSRNVGMEAGAFRFLLNGCEDAWLKIQPREPCTYLILPTGILITINNHNEVSVMILVIRELAQFKSRSSLAVRHCNGLVITEHEHLTMLHGEVSTTEPHRLMPPPGDRINMNEYYALWYFIIYYDLCYPWANHMSMQLWTVTLECANTHSDINQQIPYPSRNSIFTRCDPWDQFHNLSPRCFFASAWAQKAAM